MCAEAPEVIGWILLLFQRVASSGNSSVIACVGRQGGIKETKPIETVKSSGVVAGRIALWKL